MIEIIIYISIGLILGGIIGWFIGRLKSNITLQEQKKESLENFILLDKKYAILKATSEDLLKKHEEKKQELDNQINNLKNTNHTFFENLTTANAKNNALEEKLITQKEEIKEMSEKFNLEFKNIASEILKDNTKSFTELNETKIKALLNPLGENIKEFKQKVQDVYDKEAKERFSLGEKVKELADKSDQISQDAINLTNALKGEAKTQGNWGEMILENILEKSGLRKNEEYFKEHQLEDEDGNPLKSDVEGKKMRPDFVIKYPDNRNVIIDSKVSLNAFTRYIASDEIETQKKEIQSHVTAIKNHIIALSSKGYDDYDKSLDFVMMFIPSEPAYIAAMQADANLWNYAYDKRILLMNPTNLITSLKLIVDLWKREYQNKNAIAIADRGAKLYDKFVGFVDNLDKIGKHLNNAQNSYHDAYKQLSTGNDNLVTQTTKLKELGVKNKKELPLNLVK
ncbi:DNA recombination protein RmuC [Tenacibaculum piscium]|uniref:DNA recombination protein RmuC n=1 Tax=Tenacibaculum piscium TaxID=1458515 RepID=UPI001F18EAEB|nr:DNA recombination protein RmuC [Tenacibaculum piscium]